MQEGLRRVQAHLMIDDPSTALQEAEALSRAFPESRDAGGALVETLAAGGFEEGALDAWHRLSARHPDLLTDRRLLEELAWGVLKKGMGSMQHTVRLSSLIGAYLTHDIRAVPMLVKMLRDSNAIVRSVAVQMAADFGDTPLKIEIERMMREEKVWMVRLQVIQSAGRMRLKNLRSQLDAIVQSEKPLIEERHAAIQALVNISEGIELEEIVRLAHSPRAGLRHLACTLAAHFELPAAKEEVLRLAADTHPDVRVAALNAVGLFYSQMMTPEELQAAFKAPLAESNPNVAITAAWAAMLVQPDFCNGSFEKWLADPIADNRRLAAAALAATGDRGASLSTAMLKQSKDPYVRANLSLGLIGQRCEVAAAADCLYEFLRSEKRMWMWDSRPNPLFQILAPSQVRYVDQIPNYPEAIDQMTRLQLVSVLAMVGDARAIDALKHFLEQKKWGITGVAAATLLQEGDDSALGVVRELLNDPNAHIRLQACLVLAMYGKDDTVLQELQKAYVGADFELKLHILEALGNVGSQESFGFLVGVLSEPFPLLRVAAASALIQGLNR